MSAQAAAAGAKRPENDQQPAKRRAGSSLGELALASNVAQELTVCDITGDWGAYQWSLVLFALAYSTLSAFVVIFGPMLMPDIPFTCQDSAFANQTSESLNQTLPKAAAAAAAVAATASKDAAQCYAGDSSQQQVKCSKFNYKDEYYGLMLTNGFNLVCDRLWLRSLITSSALVGFCSSYNHQPINNNNNNNKKYDNNQGMLFSSVTLGLFSDKFGRLRCVQVASVISLAANVVAILVRNYYLFNVCIMLMCFAQIGAGNALCTLVMESTSPRFRYVPAFEYSFGWALAMALLPAMNWITHDYRWFMGLLLAWQLALLPWLHWGVFESIRWLLSEGHLNRAQIELRRACRWNGVQTDGKFAKCIAQMQAQQVRKASRVIEQDTAARRLSQALGTRIDETALELDTLSAAIKRSFFGFDTDEGAENCVDIACHAPAATNGAGLADQIPPGLALSPSLVRASFSLSPCNAQQQQHHSAGAVDADGRESQNGHAHLVNAARRRTQTFLSVNGSLQAATDRKDSLTTQGLIQLALKYSKMVESQNGAGSCFFVQMFHRKLWRQSSILLLISVMLETSFYGLLQANKFVGSSVELNYLFGALSETAAALATCGMLAFCSRRFSIVACTLVGSLICLSMALSYHLIPDPQSNQQLVLSVDSNNLLPGLNNSQTIRPISPISTIGGGLPPVLPMDSLINNDANLEPLSNLKLLADNEPRRMDATGSAEQMALIELRNRINFYLMNAGKFFISVGIQVAGIVAMEVYPNNLRQTGPGVILSAGRIGSIIAPFLFNDPTPERTTFKLTLVVLAAIGLLVCLLVPCFLGNTKDKELCDQLDECK